MKTTYFALMSVFCFSQAQAYTLPNQAIKSYECDTCSSLSRDALEDKWAISNNLLDHKLSNMQKGYGYKQQVTLKQLQSGVAISTLAPGAVIRIIPLQKKSIPQFQIKTPSNKLMNLKDASSLYSQDETSSDTYFATKHQTMLQIKPELGAGTFIIKTQNIDNKNSETYLISVLDKFSAAYLQIESDSLHYTFGDKLTTLISLKDSNIDYSVHDVDASIVGPKGQVIPLKLTKGKRNQFEATTILDSELNDLGENWYIEASVQFEYEDSIIKRSAHAAFSYSIPSASLSTIKKISSQPLTFEATLDVATASRYSLQCVLFTQNGAKIVPIETAQAAQWFAPGKHSIQFTFDNSNQLSDDSLYLGYLRLLDYGQLTTVYQYDKPIQLSQLVE